MKSLLWSPMKYSLLLVKGEKGNLSTTDDLFDLPEPLTVHQIGIRYSDRYYNCTCTPDMKHLDIFRSIEPFSCSLVEIYDRCYRYNFPLFITLTNKMWEEGKEKK